MPKGVETFVEGGFATVDFVDPNLKGAALAKLIEIGGPESVEVITRDGPRRKYRVPEGNADAAGLVDTASSVDTTATGDAGHAEALATASPAVVNSPGLAATSRGANDAGPVAQTDVVSNQSILTTASETATSSPSVAPAHVDRIARERAAAAAMRKKIRDRTAELASERGDTITAGRINVALATQDGALATDPQSRGDTTVSPPADDTAPPAPADETPAPPETPAAAPAVNPAAEAPTAPSPSGPAPLDPAKDVSLTAEGTPPVAPPAPDAAPAAPPAPDAAPAAPAEEPSLDWTRSQIDSHASEVHGIDTTTAPNKQAALQQIQEAKS